MKVIAEVSNSTDGVGHTKSDTSFLSDRSIQSNKSGRSAQSVQSEKSVHSNHTEISVKSDLSEKSIRSEQSERSVMATATDDIRSNQSEKSIKSGQSDRLVGSNPIEAVKIDQSNKSPSKVPDENTQQKSSQSQVSHDEDFVQIIPLDKSPKTERIIESEPVASPRSLPDHFFTRHTPELRKKGFEERAL